MRLESLPETIAWWRAARDAERDALAALSDMLGMGDLPPIRRDPLRNIDRGIRLAIWRADMSRGVYDINLQDDELTSELLFGRQPEGLSTQSLAPVDRDGSWQVAVQTIEGPGRYQVLQQPAEANDWTARIRIDDHDSWRSGTELVIWAVPIE